MCTMDAYLTVTPGRDVDNLTFDAWTMAKQLIGAIGVSTTLLQLADVCASIDAERPPTADGRMWDFADLRYFFEVASRRLPDLFSFEDVAFGKTVTACVVRSGILHTQRPWTCATIAKLLKPLPRSHFVATMTLIFMQDAANEVDARIRALELGVHGAPKKARCK